MIAIKTITLFLAIIFTFSYFTTVFQTIIDNKVRKTSSHLISSILWSLFYLMTQIQ